MASEQVSGGAGNPTTEQSAGEVVYDAITQWMDCTDEMLARHGNVEDYILYRLNEAGWRVVQLDQSGAFDPPDFEQDYGRAGVFYEDETRPQGCRPLFRIEGEWAS